jgi:alpha-methylacyl-CoA racemase
MAVPDHRVGPLSGIRVLEIGGLGPGPFAGLLLAEMGAEVLRIDGPTDRYIEAGGRGRARVRVDLKRPGGVEFVLQLSEQADVMFEPFRAGVAERLGIGPDVCLLRNPRLVYGRMSGWGHEGPYAQMAGHDINYIGLTGALHAIGRANEAPVIPLNLVGDFGGGGIYLAFGLVCAVLESLRSGEGQVVDASMVDGTASLMSSFYELLARGLWTDARGDNLIDSGAWFYNVYETSDQRYVAVGAIEPLFCAQLVQLTGMGQDAVERQMDKAAWPELKERLASIFATKTRDEWCTIFDGSDACVTPVLSLAEAPYHPHNVERGTFTTIDGFPQPAPAPRFSRTPGVSADERREYRGQEDRLLCDWLSCDPRELDRLRSESVLCDFPR